MELRLSKLQMEAQLQEPRKEPSQPLGRIIQKL
jgi:hypothetical protein